MQDLIKEPDYLLLSIGDIRKRGDQYATHNNTEAGNLWEKKDVWQPIKLQGSTILPIDIRFASFRRPIK